MHDASESIGQTIRRRREELGFTQAQLAERLKVHKQTIVKYEADAINIPSDRLLELANVLKLGFSIGGSRIGPAQEDPMMVREPVTTIYDGEGIPMIVEVERDGAEPKRIYPRQLQAKALRFEAEALEFGASDADLAFIRHALHSPETVLLFESGYQDKPLSAAEQAEEMDILLSELRDWLELRIKRRQERERRGV